MTACERFIVTRPSKYADYNVEFQSDPKQKKDEILVFVSGKEKPFGAFVRRNDNEYILLVPRSDEEQPSQDTVISATIDFSLTGGVKAIWVIGTDLEITEGIRGKVPNLLSEETFLPSITESDGQLDEVMQKIKDDAGTNNTWAVYVIYGIAYCLD